MFDDFELSALSDYLGQYAPNYIYADEYHKGIGGGEGTPSAGVELFPNWAGTGVTGLINTLNRMGGTGGLGGALSGLAGKGLDLATSRGGVAGIAALLSMLDRQKARGGGAGAAYAGYKPMTRTMTQGRYGPIARYAASGGLMQAYAQGGAVRPFPMQDGGFVMTKRSVDGAGGPQGMRQRLPEAVPIRGPGHGTSDSIPAYIQGENGRTPARVSNGEMYVPPGRNTQGLYALMRSLERKA